MQGQRTIRTSDRTVGFGVWIRKCDPRIQVRSITFWVCLFGKIISITDIVFYRGYLHESAKYLISTTLQSLLRKMLIHILSLYWLFSYLLTFIWFLPPSVEHSEKSCGTVHLVRQPLTPQNLEIMLPLWQHCYAQLHDPQGANPLQCMISYSSL